MKIISLLAALFAFFVYAAPASAQANVQSSPVDRQRFVTIVQNLERAPLNPGLRDDRSWAIQWLTDAPDVTVKVCADPIGAVSEKGYEHRPEILVQYMLAMAAYIIDNPGKVNDPGAQQMAGVESGLKAYRAILVAEPDKKSPQLEKLLELQGSGELSGFVRKAFARCLANGAK